MTHGLSLDLSPGGGCAQSSLEEGSKLDLLPFHKQERCGAQGSDLVQRRSSGTSTRALRCSPTATARGSPAQPPSAGGAPGVRLPHTLRPEAPQLRGGDPSGSLACGSVLPPLPWAAKRRGSSSVSGMQGTQRPGRGLGAQRGFRGRPACASCHVSSRVNRHCGSVAALPTGWPVGGFSRLAYLSSIWKRSVLKPTELRPRVPEPPRHPRQTDLWGRPRTEAPPAGPLLPNLSFPGSG